MSRFVHGYLYDVFVSYSHVDYDWVKRLHSALLAELKTRAPGIVVWRDDQLRTGDWLDARILPVVRQSAVFLPVLSGAWAASEYCRKELSEFQGGAYLCVEKVPVADLPASLSAVMRAKFYRVESGRSYTHDPGTGAFKKAVQALAEDIVSALGEFKPLPQNIERRVTAIRDRVRPLIRDRCGTMKILAMTQPIDLTGIYTDVNILEQVPSRQRKKIEELVAEARVEDFDRLGLGLIKAERIPGLDAVERHSRLQILGGPGSGKTTFLKRLAFECAEGKFRPDMIPVFVGLKEWAETNGAPALIDTVVEGWGPHAQELLMAGRALVLLDGLDEVRDLDHARVRTEIQQFTRRYRTCPIVLTCRIAAREYVFERFTEVEMADFDGDQINRFAENWFRVRQGTKTAAQFLSRLCANKPLLELASRPLLLTLLCLIFEDRIDFEGDRAEIYRDGLDVLLRRWDASRSIERDAPYKRLSVERKKDLLAEIAWKTFLDGDYFFAQEAVESLIQKFFEARSRLLEKGEELDATVLLKAMEAQHGLLVERAAHVYSFSHLTFQEYLVATRGQSTPTLWEELVPHISDRRFQEVFMLAVSLLDPSRVDPAVALRQMKRDLDGILAHDKNIQRLLDWARTERRGEWANIKRSAARRALLIYAGLTRTDRESNSKLDLATARVLFLNLSHFREEEFLRALPLAVALAPTVPVDDKQIVLINRYLTAAVNFVQCFEHATAASRATLEEIEETLFLPVMEITDRRPTRTDAPNAVKKRSVQDQGDEAALNGGDG